MTATGMTQLKVRPEYFKGTEPNLERRRYKRHNLTLLGRFMRVDKTEHTCRLANISLGGAMIACAVVPEADERIVAQFAELGTFEGCVVRGFADGFAMSFTATHRRRQKLAAQLTWLINRHELPPNDQRRPGHDRISLAPKPVTIQLSDGTVSERIVLDVSISGASIQTEMRPSVGTHIIVGRLPARVVRHHEFGIGVEFLHIQSFERIREDFA